MNAGFIFGERIRRGRKRALPMTALAAVTALVSGGGCASDSAETKTMKPHTVNVQAFSQPENAPSSRSATTALAEVTASSQPGSAVASIGAASQPAATKPAPVAARPLHPGDEAVVESLIGQVSGRPIFADDILAPISDQLRREAERLSPTDFVQRARKLVSDRLTDVVRNELFLAESEASLTEQEQTGLLAFLKNLNEKTIAEKGGTIFGTEQKIAAEQEMTLQQYQQAQKDAVLIQKLLYDRIEPRVIVSWRDVQREYELRKAEFNPPATVFYRRLSLSNTSDADAITQVKQRLGANEDFDAVVASLSDSITSGQAKMGPTGLADMPDVNEAFRPALAKLKGAAGETTEPVERQGRTVWLHIDKIDQPPGKTLFDVQEQLISELRVRRQNEEYLKYLQTLFQKGTFDEMDQMTRRVLAVALLRYAR